MIQPKLSTFESHSLQQEIFKHLLLIKVFKTFFAHWIKKKQVSMNSEVQGHFLSNIGRMTANKSGESVGGLPPLFLLWSLQITW